MKAGGHASTPVFRSERSDDHVSLEYHKHQREEFKHTEACTVVAGALWVIGLC